jgi:hypothetical protein
LPSVGMTTRIASAEVLVDGVSVGSRSAVLSPPGKPWRSGRSTGQAAAQGVRPPQGGQGGGPAPAAARSLGNNDEVETKAERLAALEDLVLLRVPIGGAIARLGGFPWDSDVHLVALTRQHVDSLLAAYLEGRLDEQDCENWASALEGRDDVGFEPGFERSLSSGPRRRSCKAG